MTLDVNVLVIGGRDFQIKGLQELGIPFVLFQKKDELTDYQVDTVERIFIFDYLNQDLAIAYARLFHSHFSFGAVIAYREYAQLPCALIADDLKLISNCQTQVVTNTRNKLLMRECLRAVSGLDTVRYSLVNTCEDLKAFFEQDIEKAILKPSDGTGSCGVLEVTRANLQSAFDYCRNATTSELIVEEFIGGTEYSVETISRNGVHEVLAITQKTTTGAPSFVELAHFQPAPLSVAERDQIETAVATLFNTLGYRTGPGHTEVKLYRDSVYIIETHTRNGGDNIWRMTQLTTGRDMFKETIATLLSLPLEKKSPACQAAKVQYFFGSLRRASLDELRTLSGLGDSELVDATFVESPAAVGQLSSSLDRSGFVLLCGGSEKHIANNLQTIESVLTDGES